jgi:DNA-binding PadR family transcriptional regulator
MAGNRSELPLTPRVFHILLALADGPEHGYRIMKEIEARSEGRVRIGPGTLYEAIHRLVESGWIRPCPAPPSEGADSRRRHYRLSARGRAVLKAESQRLAELVEHAASRGLVQRA